MGRENLTIERDAMDASFAEVEKSPLLLAVEAAEATMVPLLLDADNSEHIAEEFAPPGLAIAEAKEKGLSIKKLIIAALEERRVKYTALKISGVLDKAGAKAVYEARIEMKNIRLHFEKAGKKLTEAAKAHIKNVGLEGKQLIGLSSVTEDYLEAEEKAYTTLVDAEKAAKQKILDDRNQGRMNALLAVGAVVELAAVVQMTDEMFTSYLALATKSFEDQKAIAAEAAAAEAARIEAEAAEKARAAKEEADRLQAEREANAKAKEENDRIAAELKAQQDAINKQKADMERAQREEQIRKDAEAKTKADAEAKAAADKAREIAEIARALEIEAAMELSRKAKAEDEAARLAAIEAAKPDAEKLRALAQSFDAIPMPEVTTEAGSRARAEICNACDRFVTFINTKADSLTK